MFCPLNKALHACFHSHYFLILWNFLLTKPKKRKHYATHFSTCCSVVKLCLLFVSPWTVACQAPLPFSISWSSLKSISIELVMLSDHLIFCFPFLLLPQSLPASGSFPMNWLFSSCGQSIGASASASVLPMNIQGWFPLGWTGSISLQSKGLSRVFSSTTIWRYQFFSAQPSLWTNSHTWA